MFFIILKDQVTKQLDPQTLANRVEIVYTKSLFWGKVLGI